jgi:hypothetical protein
MLYVKNLPGWERAVRMLMGAGLIAAALAYFGPTTVGWAMGLGGATAMLSGLFGFCPACAMVGRRLEQ